MPIFSFCLIYLFLLTEIIFLLDNLVFLFIETFMKFLRQVWMLLDDDWRLDDRVWLRMVLRVGKNFIFVGEETSGTVDIWH